jgi:hypothetical protein
VQHDKRQSERRQVMVECQIEGFSARAQMRISDLSSRGCYVDSLIPISVGSRVTLRVILRNRSLSLGGEVTHCKPGMGFGIRFDPVPPAMAEIIDRFLSGDQE